jgi:hypothetical protein
VDVVPSLRGFWNLQVGFEPRELVGQLTVDYPDCSVLEQEFGVMVDGESTDGGASFQWLLEPEDIVTGMRFRARVLEPDPALTMLEVRRTDDRVRRQRLLLWAPRLLRWLSAGPRRPSVRNSRWANPRERSPSTPSSTKSAASPLRSGLGPPHPAWFGETRHRPAD